VQYVSDFQRRRRGRKPQKRLHTAGALNLGKTETNLYDFLIELAVHGRQAPRGCHACGCKLRLFKPTSLITLSNGHSTYYTVKSSGLSEHTKPLLCDCSSPSQTKHFATTAFPTTGRPRCQRRAPHRMQSKFSFSGLLIFSLAKPPSYPGCDQ
jgi:hypothetical protein